MPFGRGHQIGKHLSDIPFRQGKTVRDKLRQCDRIEPAEGECLHLAVERSGPVLEGRGDHSGLAATEQVTRRLALMLCVRADDRLGPIEAGQALEFVQHDQHPAVLRRHLGG